ncbi:hypothetical protein CEXT_125901, partial [Caerostris extrusa]
MAAVLFYNLCQVSWLSAHTYNVKTSFNQRHNFGGGEYSGLANGDSTSKNKSDQCAVHYKRATPMLILHFTESPFAIQQVSDISALHENLSFLMWNQQAANDYSEQ